MEGRPTLPRGLLAMQSFRIVARWVVVSFSVWLALVSATAAFASGSTVTGQINLNTCGGPNGNLPTFTVKLSTTPLMTTTTNSNGAFTFTNVPNGTYTVTPSITGPSAVFYPATQSVNVTTSSSPSTAFSVSLGYTVSGAVAYSGSDTGRIYVTLNNNNCGGGAPGTSIASKGTFTIRGVPPGSYSVQSWMDTIGYGAPNAADPSTNVNGPVNLSVSNANVTGITATLGTPPAVTVSSAPGIQGIAPFNGGVTLFFQPIQNNNGVEVASSYTVEWSTTQTFPSTVPTSQTKSFPAVGSNGTSIWIINGLTNGQAYYFRVRGVAGSSNGPWFETASATTVNAPSTGVTVSGTVTFPGTATGPLYTGFYDENSNKLYVTVVGSKASPPTSPAAYSVKIPASTNGPNYIHVGILDNKNLGVIVPGDIDNTNGNKSAPIAITGNQTGDTLVLPTTNSSAMLSTQHNQQINQFGTSTGYDLSFDVEPGIKLPVSVALTSASNPNVVVPADIGQCDQCGGNGPYAFQVGINGAVPKVGDTYGFSITYSDGTTGTASAAVTGVVSSLPSQLQPAGPGSNTKPNFSWTDPTNASNYTYQFQLQDANYNTIWQIPGQNSNGSGFSSSLTSLTWGVAPAGYSGDTPSVAQLSAEEYTWFVQATDTNGNSAQTMVDYYPGFTALSLPTSAAAKLPSATEGTSYTATIAAAGGYPCYSYSVSGNLSNYGLNWSMPASCGGPLTINGKPTASGTATFSVTASDSSHTQVTQSYSITIGGGSLSLPSTTPPTLGSATSGVVYAGTIVATGGSAPYTWEINNVTLSNNNTAVAIASGNGLTATSNGTSTLTIGGTPTTGPIALNVIVKSGTTQATGSYMISVGSGVSGVNNSSLNGRYTCLTEGFVDSDGSRWGTLSTFTANGSGTLGVGVYNSNSVDAAAATSGTISGSYSIGADNNGIATIVTTQTGQSSVTEHWALAITGLVKPAQEFRAVEQDTNGQHAMANCYLDTTGAFVAGTISGHGFALQMNGEKKGSNSVSTVLYGEAAAGRFSASSGNISTGMIDIAKAGTASAQESTFTGTYTTPDANGRSTLTLNTGNGSVTLAVYIIDSNRMFILETASGDGLLIGNLRTQASSSFTVSSLSGPFVIYDQGVSFGAGDVERGLYSQVIQATSTGTGVIVANASFADNAGTYVVNGAVGTDPALTFSSTDPGRATVVPGSGELYLYFWAPDEAFTLSSDGNGGYSTGWLEKQTLPSISNTALAGTYMGGPMPLTSPTGAVSVGEYKFSGTSITAGITTATESTYSFDQTVNMSYLLANATDQTITISSGSGGFASCIAVSSSPIKLACTTQNTPAPSVFLLQQ